MQTHIIIRSFIISLLLSLIAISCSKQPAEESVLFPEKTDEVLSTKAECSIVEKDYFITPEMIQAFVQSDKDIDRTIVSITPYPDNEDPALYVVNYEEGWSVFPTDARLGLSLIDNPTGQLDLSEPTGNVGFDIWVEDLVDINRAAKKDLTRDVGKESASIWDIFRSSINRARGTDAESKSTRAFDTWVKVWVSNNSSSTTLADKGHLLPTKWGQGAPWNVSMPSYNGINCQAGCAPVAVAQVLYYYHSINCYPTGLYHSLSIASTTNYLINNVFYCTVTLNRSNFTSNSSRWADMPLYSTGGTTSGYQYVSELLLDVGERLGAIYGINETGTPTNSYNYFDISPCKIYGLWGTYSSSTDVDHVLASLSDSVNSPVVMSAQSQTNPDDRHTWVIDGYKTTQTSTSETYAWYPVELVPPGSTIIEYKSLADLYAQYPNLDVGMEVIENAITYTETQYKMNWGWPSLNYDDGLYSTMVYAIWHDYSPNKAYHYHFFPAEFNL